MHILNRRQNVDWPTEYLRDVVGTNKSDITRITDAIHGLGVKVDSSEMMRKRHIQPFNHFFLQRTEEMDARATNPDENDESVSE